jgi:Helix-turn-helix domain of resolvase
VAGRYSNRPDLLKQLQRVAAILSDDGQDDGKGAEVASESVIRSRRMRDRFSPEDLQTMIDLYKSGTTARQVAEKFGVSLGSIKRLLHQHGVHREHGFIALSAGDRCCGAEGKQSFGHVPRTRMNSLVLLLKQGDTYAARGVARVR